MKSKRKGNNYILSSKGNKVELPLLKGTLGPDVVDIRNLYKQFGIFSHDPGYMSTSSCDSKITFVDGDKGILLYRGYNAADLAEKSSFEEVAYLLIHGELPNKKEKNKFETHLNKHSMVHQQLSKFYDGFRRSAHPMAIMVGVVGALSAFYEDTLDIENEEHRIHACYRMVAKMPTIAAMAFKYSIGQPFIYPRNRMTYCDNFLRMCFGVPTESYKNNKVLSEAINRILILHADHEQNASTSTVRQAGSSGANPFACIASGIACLWGPAHGGANEAALNMLETIKNKKNIPEYIARAKNKDDPFLLMGFGHRVYKNYDPRAKVMKKTCHNVLKEIGKTNTSEFEVALELERIALSDEYFIKRKLYPNVDFYTGITLKAMGFPKSMFTPIFAVARTVGWIAQWLEMIKEPKRKIARPRQLYTGKKERNFVALTKRK